MKNDAYRRPLDRQDWLIALAVFAVALAVRLVFLYTSPDRGWPHSILYEGDAPTWVVWAQQLDRGEAFEFDLPLRSPAVAFVLHWFTPGVIERPFTGWKVVWCVATALACALTYMAVAMFLSRRVGLIAAGLCTFSFGIHLLSTSLNNEALYMPVVVATALLTQVLVSRRRSGAMWLAVALGVLHGVAMLIRPEHMLLLGLLAGYVWLSAGGVRLSTAARPGPTLRFGPAWIVVVMILTAVIVCLPWSVRGSQAVHRFNTVSPDVPTFERAQPPWTPEARAFIESLPAFAQAGNFQFITFLARQEGQPQVTIVEVQDFFTNRFDSVPQPLRRWSLLSIKGPLDFALANHPDVGGAFSKAALEREGETDPALLLGRPDHLKLLNHGYSVGLGYIRSDFGDWLRLVGAKLSNFFDGVTHGFTSANLPLGLDGERRQVDMFTAEHESPVIQTGWNAVVLALVLGGVVIAMVRRVAGIWIIIIAYKLIVTVLFYGYARQAASILPAFFVLMALSLDQIIALVNTRLRLKPRSGWITAAVLALALLVVEIAASVKRPYFTITGPVHLAPQWGEDAFESFGTLELRRSSRED